MPAQILPWIFVALNKLPPVIEPPDPRPVIILPVEILPVTDKLDNVPNAVIYGWLLVVNVDPELPVYVGNKFNTFE